MLASEQTKINEFIQDELEKRVTLYLKGTYMMTPS